MSEKSIELLDTVALIEDVPDTRLSRGEVGTVVEVLEPDVHEVEFSDDRGETYAELPFQSTVAVSGASLRNAFRTTICAGATPLTRPSAALSRRERDFL